MTAPTGAQCGTYAAYQAHRKHGQRGDEIDTACRRAGAEHVSEWRARNGRTKGTLVPYRLLGELLALAPADLRQRATVELGDVAARAIELAGGRP